MIGCACRVTENKVGRTVLIRSWDCMKARIRGIQSMAGLAGDEVVSPELVEIISDAES